MFKRWLSLKLHSCLNLLSASWHRTAPPYLVSQSTRVMCQPGIGSDRRYWQAHRAVIPFVYSRSKNLSDCRRLYLEQFAGGCDFCAITDCIQTTSEAGVKLGNPAGSQLPHLSFQIRHMSCIIGIHHIEIQIRYLFVGIHQYQARDSDRLVDPMSVLDGWRVY